MSARKPQPPAITVKVGFMNGVAGHVVRVDGVAVAVHSGEDGQRKAMRHRDKLTAHWKTWTRSPTRMEGQRWDHSEVEV